MVNDNQAAPAKDKIQRVPSLAGQVAQALQTDIEQGLYQPGDKLPPEHVLVTSYGVSRPIIREAIGRLKHSGLVISRQGAGAFVADKLPSGSFHLEIKNPADRKELKQILELLIAVEGAATEIAAMRSTKRHLERIKSALERMREAIDTGEPGVEEDIAFHRSIFAAVGNPFFTSFSEFLNTQIRHFIRTARANTARSGVHVQNVQKEHVAIYEAIASRNPAAARAAAEQHLKNAGKRLSLYLSDPSAPAWRK